MVFVYYDSEGSAPLWEPPALDVSAGWTAPRHTPYDIHDHPQETVENSVDMGHFGIVHGYTDMLPREELTVAGPHFHIAYTARRPMPFLPRLGKRIGFLFDIDIWGLALSPKGA